MDNNSFFEVWAKESPETSKAFFEFAGTIGKFGGLDPKTHQLVYIGMQVCKGNVSSVCAHAGFAKALGATRQEIIGVIATSMMEVGINGIAQCLVPVLEAYDAAPDPEPKVAE